ncbi:MAG: SGNH/GDSL hydrolase family protein [Acidobacteria bacterium]|nr:SGNH/GDSL hydrolase family protein [Acidobacteriota bacterium]
MRAFLALASLATLATAAYAQQPALLPATELSKLTERMQMVAESVAIVIPDLPRAAGPILEQIRPTRLALDRTPQSTKLTYTLLGLYKNYLMLADALPKPIPFPAVGAQQLNELRDGWGKLENHFQALIDSRESQLTPADRDNLARYKEANSQLGAPASGKPRVVFMGDSITDGWPLKEYFSGKDFVNRGISGQVTGQMLGRMQADVINLKPAVMVVLAGTNDIARGTPIEIIQNNLRMMCDLADHAHIKVVLGSVLPIHDYNQNIDPRFARSPQRPPATINALNAWMKSLAESKGYVYLDYFNSVRDGAGYLRKDVAEDGLHPNAMGYRLMAPLAERAVEDALAGRVATPRKK